jgi:Domain of unknown function (DUF4136)
MNADTRMHTAALALVTMTLVACTATRVNTDSNAATSVSACHSFSWVDPTVAPPPAYSAFANPINDQRLRTAVAKRLAARAILPVENGAVADCLVSHAIGTRESFSESAGRSHFSFGIGTGFGFGRHSGGSVFIDSSEPYAYREGRIAVDLFRASSHEPVWHADAEVDVSRLTGVDAESRIDAVVTAIFAKFPAAR